MLYICTYAPFQFAIHSKLNGFIVISIDHRKVSC
jgi:hypothetical protein